MWNKPDSEDLLPLFMQEATGFIKAMSLCFGIPVVAACLLLYHNNVSFAYIVPYYAHILGEIFSNLGPFYLFHLLAALLLRFAAYGKRLPARTACVVAVTLDLLAIMFFYPARSFLNPQILKNVFLFVALWPSLMTFFILRIHRLYVAGGIVIAVFVGLLCAKLI